jgi:benzoyl-CoA reductase subunit C
LRRKVGIGIGCSAVIDSLAKSMKKGTQTLLPEDSSPAIRGPNCHQGRRKMIEEFVRYRLTRHERATNWKEDNGSKIIGALCCCVPEEIIHAAGMLPVRILGEQGETGEAEAQLPANLCPYCKRCLDQVLKGRYYYLDGLVIPNLCPQANIMYDFSKHTLKIPFIHFMEIPPPLSENRMDLFTQELVRLQEALEDLIGRKISPPTLRQSMRLYNENRALLERVYDLRKRSPPVVAGSEAQEIVISSMLMPKELHNWMLAHFLEVLPQRDDPPEPGVRVFVSASTLDNTDFLQLIEECGGSVVADDMPMGSQYFSGPITISGDPLHALADRYLNKTGCPGKMLPEQKVTWATRMMKQANVKGAIILDLTACDPHRQEYRLIRKRLQEERIPFLFLQVDGLETQQEPLRADIKAFIETLTAQAMNN